MMKLGVGDTEAPGPEEWQYIFLEMLPTIERQASFAFRSLDPESKQDAICDVVAKAFHSYRRLLDRGQPTAVSATTLARFAVVQYWDGRRFGTSNASQDAMSDRSPMERESGFLEDELIDSRWVSICRQVALTIDFDIWKNRLTHRDRRIVTKLLEGFTTNEIAIEFNLSAARVSQLRRQLAKSWSTI